MFGGGLKLRRPARRRATAHQLGWIGVVSKADRMPTLVRNYVARDVRKGQRIKRARGFSKPFQVTDGRNFRLQDIDPRDTRTGWSQTRFPLCSPVG
jgi:hypothetical protein